MREGRLCGSKACWGKKVVKSRFSIARKVRQVINVIPNTCTIQYISPLYTHSTTDTDYPRVHLPNLHLHLLSTVDYRIPIVVNTAVPSTSKNINGPNIHGKDVMEDAVEPALLPCWYDPL